jgi:hypothetical protein
LKIKRVPHAAIMRVVDWQALFGKQVSFWLMPKGHIVPKTGRQIRGKKFVKQ